MKNTITYILACLLILSSATNISLAALPEKKELTKEERERLLDSGVIKWQDSHVWKEFEAKVKALGYEPTDEEKQDIYWKTLKKHRIPEIMDEIALKKLHEHTGYFVGMLPCTAKKNDGGEFRVFHLLDFGKDKESCLFKMGEVFNHFTSSGLDCTVDEKKGCFDEKFYEVLIQWQKEGRQVEKDYVRYIDHDSRFRSFNIDTIPYNPTACLKFETLFNKNFKEAKCIHRENEATSP